MATVNDFGLPYFALDEQPSTPANAAAGTKRMFLDNTGVLRLVDETGAVVAVGSDGGAGTGYAEGTSFPGTPATGTKFYRTDRNLLYFYDGTRWLTVNQYVATVGNPTPAYPASATNTLAGRMVFPGGVDVYIETLVVNLIIGATNNSTNYWEAEVVKYDNAATKTRIGASTASTAADTANTRISKSLTINTVYTAADSSRDTGVNLLKTGTPSTLYCNAIVTYRLVG